MNDDLDRRIILELQEDGRQTYVDVANKLGVTEGTVRKRVRHMLNDDIIKIVAVPNVRKLGYNFITITALHVAFADVTKVAGHLAEKPNVCYLTFVTGRYEFMAIIMTRSAEEFSHFMQTEIFTIPGILSGESLVNLEINKGGWGLLDTTDLIRSFDISSPRKP